MNYFFSSLCLVVVVAFGSAAAQDSEVAVLALLSHGYELPTGETCTSEEWNSIVHAMDGARRKLRGDRGRVLYPTWCNEMCRGFAAHQCYLVFSYCAGFVAGHRSLESTIPKDSGANIVESASVRLLGNVNEACSQKISDVNTALDGVKSSLSNKCQAVVQSGRDYTCFEVNLKEILKFKLYNSDTDQVMDDDFVDGATICESQSFNIEAVAGTDVTRVYFRITGGTDFIQTHTERQAAWMAFGKSGSNMYGQNLNAGSYTLRATPDRDSSKNKIVSFNVVAC